MFYAIRRHGHNSGNGMNNTHGCDSDLKESRERRSVGRVLAHDRAAGRQHNRAVYHRVDLYQTCSTHGEIARRKRRRLHDLHDLRRQRGWSWPEKCLYPNHRLASGRQLGDSNYEDTAAHRVNLSLIRFRHTAPIGGYGPRTYS